MKNRVSRILSFGIALAAVTTVYAQQKTMKANVPFSFNMGSTVMPEGTYRVSEAPNNAVMWLTANRGGATKAVITIGTAGKEFEPARLVFHRYGEEYFLAQIWTGNGSNGRVLPRSEREKELALSGARPTLAMINLALSR